MLLIKKNAHNKLYITRTTQSRSIATPKAKPASLSIAPARTSTINQGRVSIDEADVGGTLVSAWITIATDNNWADA